MEESKTAKTLLIVGKSGDGKTTHINAMINYLMGVQYSDPFRLVMIDEASGNQAESQTQDIKTYEIKSIFGNLRLIDTPGFGDTRGPERDKEIAKKISKFILEEIGETIHGLLFIVKSSDARMCP